MNEQEKRNLILKIAQTKVGIKENPPNSNKVIFNTLFYGKEVQDGIGLDGKPNKNAAYPWCATSVSEIFQEAKLPLGKIGWNRGYAGCPYAIEHLSSWGKEVSYKDSLPGDIIFFSWKSNGVWNHTGILKSKGDINFITLEGNTAVGNDSNGGEYMERQRNIFAGLKFVRPNVYN